MATVLTVGANTTRRCRSITRRTAVGAFAIIMAGCTGSRSCTVIGSTSHVGFALPARDWTLTEFCVDEECLAPSELHAGSLIRVDDEPADYEYRLVAIDPSGETVRHSGEVRTKPFRVNGPGCGPLTANAVLVVRDDGSVTVRHPGDATVR